MLMVAGLCRSVESPRLAQPACRGSQAWPTAPDLSSGGNAFVGSNPIPCISLLFASTMQAFELMYESSDTSNGLMASRSRDTIGE